MAFVPDGQRMSNQDDQTKMIDRFKRGDIIVARVMFNRSTNSILRSANWVTMSNHREEVIVFLVLDRVRNRYIDSDNTSQLYVTQRGILRVWSDHCDTCMGRCVYTINV